MFNKLWNWRKEEKKYKMILNEIKCNNCNSVIKKRNFASVYFDKAVIPRLEKIIEELIKDNIKLRKQNKR